MADAREDYRPYYYLWHLIALGVLKATPPADGNGHLCPHIDKAIWDHPSLKNGRQNVKVALIDMGIARHHPNLSTQAGAQQVDWDNALDLASHRFGATYTGTDERHLERRKQHLANIPDNLVPLTPDETAILAELKNGWGVERYVTAYPQGYPTHGTACAGLVCGTSDPEDQFGHLGSPVVYYGVDPFSKIVPITTSISPDPKQLIAAFLYAHSLDVDVILLPRDCGDPANTPGFASLDQGELTRLDDAAELVDAWTLLGKIVLAVSEDIPVVCAAGNDGRSALIYPASLSAQAGNGIISVGAISFAGYRSGYSNYGAGLTCVAPSDDGEVYNRHQIRLDRKAVDFADHWIEGVHHPQIAEIPFSPERLVTLDVPGPRGYVDGSRRGPVISRAEAVDDPGSLYTEFGGTSGAAALVAGVCALMQRQSQQRIAGTDLKTALVQTPNFSPNGWHWLEGGANQLQADAINGGAPAGNPALFGAGGLVDAPALLGIDWNDVNP